MLKDYFQKNIQTINILRSEHFKVTEYLSKGKYRMKQKFFGKGKKHYDFDLNSQEFFHEYVDDIVFQSIDIQQAYYSHINKLLQQPLSFNYQIKENQQIVPPRKNPSDTRATLSRHFHTRVEDLNYKKYLTLQRLHNVDSENYIKTVQVRTHLIDREIKMCLERETRLISQDYFEVSYTQGGKPVPVNENGQPIYKYLDEEESWFSNISRDDVIVYSRNYLYKEQLLNSVYWPILYDLKYIVFANGVAICTQAQEIIRKRKNELKERIVGESKRFLENVEKELQQISPGNLTVKEDLITFIYNITGVSQERPLKIPLYPAIYTQICDLYRKAVDKFFKGVRIEKYHDIVTLLPKLNNFCLIMFKYQNCEILQGEREIKLGLDDDVDIKKQLITMLQELWVRNYVNINYSRFDYKLNLRPCDWQFDEFSKLKEKQLRYKNQNGYSNDLSLQKLIRLTKMTNYSDFRKIIKKRAEQITERLPKKYEDMELTNIFSQKSDQQINSQKLTQFFKSKGDQFYELYMNKKTKQSSKAFFNTIIKKVLVSNPSQVQILQTLSLIHMRELRTKMMNIMNGIRCYQRNIDMDLRVMSGCEFEFEMDDKFLINSNKQIIDNFQKTVKDNETIISKASKVSKASVVPTLDNEDFLIKGKQKKSMLYKKDVVQRQFYGSQIPHIMVKDGKKKKNKIMYDIVLQDIQLLEDRILQYGTIYINRYERLLKIRGMPQLVDRSKLLTQIYEYQIQYLYEKFKLIQTYYYAYQNTTQPLNAHKLGKAIVELIYTKPQIDLNEEYFIESYELLIQQIKTQNKAVQAWIKMIQQRQDANNKQFHKKYADMNEIPLTMWGYIYGDMQAKLGGRSVSKLQRMNSISSKMSKKSIQDPKQRERNQKDQIKEEFVEDSEDEQEAFNILEYDEYMLKRNMDDIFEDIVQETGQDNGNKESGGNVTNLGLENLTINPRFEGGPHPQLHHLPQIKITSTQKKRLINFSEVVCWVINLRTTLKSLKKEHQQMYGYCSQVYNLAVSKVITEKAYRTIIQTKKPLKAFHEFETDDPYHESVTKCMRYYEQTMYPILDPPSIIQLSIPSTHEKHQQNLPNYTVLQHLDMHSLSNLIKLSKPVNAICYRELNLGINYLQFLQLRDTMKHLQYQRQKLVNSYKGIATACQILIQKYSNCYTRTGQSQVFESLSEIKCFVEDIMKYPVLNQSIKELRLWLQCQATDIQYFKSVLQIYKIKVQDYLRIAMDIKNPNVNTVINKKEILISEDAKNMKMIKNRSTGFVSTIASENLKTNSFLKCKAKLKTSLEERIRKETGKNLQGLMKSKFLSGTQQKISPYSKQTLQEKARRVITRECIQKYISDMKHMTSNNATFINTSKTIKKLNNYIRSLPYFSKLFYQPTQYQNLHKKTFYDQKPIKMKEQKSKFDSILYIYSQEQLIQEWQEIQHNIKANNLTQEINLQQFFNPQLAPTDKDAIFKWMFNIPQNSLQSQQRQALRHLIRVGESSTGKRVAAEYKLRKTGQSSRNKFSTLYSSYSSLVQYLQSHLLVISLQVDDDIYDSMFNLIKQNCNFEERYPILDQTTIYDNQENVLAPCFIYENKKDDLEKKLKIKISSRGYVDKKVHWAVVDQILDFIICKVQGYGVMRQSLVALRDQLSLFNNVPIDKATKFMESRTLNIYKSIWLSIWETYVNNPNDQFSKLVLPLSDALCSQNPLQNFKVSQDTNERRGISGEVSRQQTSKLKYGQGFYDTKRRVMMNKLKPLFVYTPLDIRSYVGKYLTQIQGNQYSQTPVHNWNNLQNLRHVIKNIGIQNRLKIFGNVRYFNQKSAGYLSSRLNVQSNNINHLTQRQVLKSSYLSYFVDVKIQLVSLSVLGMQEGKHNWQQFTKVWKNNMQTIDYSTFNIYDQLQNYKSLGKITFNKSEIALIGRNEGKKENEYNKMVRQVIFGKLAKEQTKYTILTTAIQMLKRQKYPKSQAKKIINTSLIPRVHLIASYSSPLITERKTYVSQQYKLAFVQAFINRFRNKVSRVDLLSSGYGFVITVPDLQDCVNYLNKLLFTFTQKEFRSRLDTYSQYYEILMQGIEMKNKVIFEQQCTIKHLQNKVNNTLQIQYLSRVSKLLKQKILIQDKLKTAEQASNGLQVRVRKAVQLQYKNKVVSLEEENAKLQKNFLQFQNLIVTLTKDTTKNNFLSVLNIFRKKVNETLDKKIDLTPSFESMKAFQTKQLEGKLGVKEEEENKKFYNQEQEYSQEDIQKCKIGEDIIHDPYYTTKLINKMRLFNVFKMGCKKLKHQSSQSYKNQQLHKLHQIQDSHITQTQREAVLRDELIKTQKQLSRKCTQLDKLKQTTESLKNKKAQWKILMNTKDKKLEQKERQVSEMKIKLEEKGSETKIQSKTPSEVKDKPQQLPKLGNLKEKKKISNKRIDRSFITNIQHDSASISLYEKFELSSKDSTWRQKCEQLYIENKKLMQELEKLKEGNTGTTDTPIQRQVYQREGHSLNLRQKRASQMVQTPQSKDRRKFPNPSFKYNVIKQGYF